MALSFRSLSVTFGSLRLTLPALIAAATGFGIRVASTLRPTDSAVFGLTPDPTPPFLRPAIARCSCSAPPQKAWSPNVSNLKIRRPRATERLAGDAAPAREGLAADPETAATVPFTTTNARKRTSAAPSRMTNLLSAFAII